MKRIGFACLAALLALAGIVAAMAVARPVAPRASAAVSQRLVYRSVVTYNRCYRVSERGIRNLSEFKRLAALNKQVGSALAQMAGRPSFNPNEWKLVGKKVIRRGQLYRNTAICGGQLASYPDRAKKDRTALTYENTVTHRAVVVIIECGNLTFTIVMVPPRVIRLNLPKAPIIVPRGKAKAEAVATATAVAETDLYITVDCGGGRTPMLLYFHMKASASAKSVAEAQGEAAKALADAVAKQVNDIRISVSCPVTKVETAPPTTVVVPPQQPQQPAQPPGKQKPKPPGKPRPTPPPLPPPPPPPPPTTTECNPCDPGPYPPPTTTPTDPVTITNPDPPQEG